MNKLLEQIIFKRLFEDTVKTVIKQAPRAVVDKARALKGFAFRIQSSRTGGTVDIETLIKRVRINDQYGENTHTSDDRWVYIFGADLRDAERKFFCNVLILPADAAMKLYGKDGVIDAQEYGTIGTAPIYREAQLNKPTPGEQVDKTITVIKSVLSNDEPLKNSETDSEKASEKDSEKASEKDSEKDSKKTASELEKPKDSKKTEPELEKPQHWYGKEIDPVLGRFPENTIVMPAAGFKYGIKDNKELAKLQLYLIDFLQSTNGAELYNIKNDNGEFAFKPIADKFIAYGADGDYGPTTNKILFWFCWAADIDSNFGATATITPEIVTALLKGQELVKVIMESRVSYKPKYMTIIQSKILQEQLKLNVNKPLPVTVTPAPAKPKTTAPAKPKTTAPAKPVTPAPAKPVTPAPAKPVTPAPAKPVTPAEASMAANVALGLMQLPNWAVIPKATYDYFKSSKDRKSWDVQTGLFLKILSTRKNLIVRAGIDPAYDSLQGYATPDRNYAYMDWLSTADWHYAKIYKGATLPAGSVITNVKSRVFWTDKSANASPQFETWYYISVTHAGKKTGAWFPTSWFELPTK